MFQVSRLLYRSTPEALFRRRRFTSAARAKHVVLAYAMLCVGLARSCDAQRSRHGHRGDRDADENERNGHAPQNVHEKVSDVAIVLSVRRRFCRHQLKRRRRGANLLQSAELLDAFGVGIVAVFAFEICLYAANPHRIAGSRGPSHFDIPKNLRDARIIRIVGLSVSEKLQLLGESVASVKEKRRVAAIKPGQGADEASANARYSRRRLCQARRFGDLQGVAHAIYLVIAFDFFFVADGPQLFFQLSQGFLLRQLDRHDETQPVFLEFGGGGPIKDRVRDGFRLRLADQLAEDLDAYARVRAVQCELNAIAIGRRLIADVEAIHLKLQLRFVQKPQRDGRKNVYLDVAAFLDGRTQRLGRQNLARKTIDRVIGRERKNVRDDHRGELIGVGAHLRARGRGAARRPPKADGRAGDDAKKRSSDHETAAANDLSRQGAYAEAVEKNADRAVWLASFELAVRHVMHSEAFGRINDRGKKGRLCKRASKRFVGRPATSVG
ncbi:MAG: hypothetical protein J0H41_04095 [Rhizobiales bacterium]|nr:hypothetical protein [Hyphomicrobiales bacterium]